MNNKSTLSIILSLNLLISSSIVGYAEEALPEPAIQTAPVVPDPAPVEEVKPVVEEAAVPAPTAETVPLTVEEQRLREELKKIRAAQTEPSPEASTEPISIEKVSIDDAGNKLLILIQTSKPVEAFVFERNDPPSLFVQFMSSHVVTSAPPIQVVGIQPLTEIRYGYSSFHDATSGSRDANQKFPIDYIELRTSRPVFYHVQQEGWVLVIGLDKTSAKVEVPELDFRFDTASYAGAANLPVNPRLTDFVETAIANSQLLAVARDETELASARVNEAKRSLMPALTARLSGTRGKEDNPSTSGAINGFESLSFKRDEYGLQINQPVYMSGRLVGAYRQSKLNRFMAEENVRKQGQDLGYEVKKAYFTLLKNQARLRVRRELVAQGDALKVLVNKKYKLELTSRSEVLNVVAQADQASYQLVSDEQDVTLARLVLISLLNQNETVPDPVPGELSDKRLSFNVESIIGWAKDHRPDVRIARLNAELAKENWNAEKGERGIKVDASGFIGKSGAAFEGEDFEMEDSWNLGLKVVKDFWGNSLKADYSQEQSAPDLGQFFFRNTQRSSIELGILDNMPGVSDTRQAELQYQRAKAELVEASRKAEYEVRETYYNLEKASSQLDAVNEDLIFRKKDLEITREKVKLGLSEMSQLMAAEVAFSQTQITEQDALAAYNVALAAMDRVAGAEVVRR